MCNIQMSYIANKLFKEHLSHSIRFIFLVLVLMIMILSTINSLNHLSATTLFSYPETIATDSYGVKEISLADINNDMYIDIVAANYNSGSIDVYTNPSSTSAVWNKTTVRSNIQDISNVLTADIDNDSDIDIISSDTGSLSIILDVNLDGKGSSWETRTITSTAGAIKSMCLGDLNNDGTLDIVAADDSLDRIFYMQNNFVSNNSWQSVSIYLYENPKNPTSVFCNDMDNDNDIDVVSTSQNSSTINWHENVAGDGSQWETHEISNSVASVNKIFVSDLDNDSYYDIVSISPASSTINFHRNIEGDGKTWESTIIYENINTPTDLFLIDLDSDGDDDILTGSNQPNSILWLENTLPLENNWISKQIGSSITYPSTIKAADIDRDGDNDVVFGSIADSTIHIGPNLFSQTSYNSISDIVNSSIDNHISAILGQAFVSNNDLLGADNSVLISIYDPNRNSNPQVVETIPSSDITITNLNSQISASILLRETNVNSSLFIGEFFVNTDYSGTNIQAKDLDRIEVKYKTNNNIIITAHTNTNKEYVIVDGTKPNISNLYPNSNIKDTISSYKFEGLIEDSIIGLGPDLETVESNIIFVIDNYSFKPNLTYLGYGKWSANLNINLAEGTHTWRISSSDLLGNTANSALLDLEVDITPPYFVRSGNNKSRTGDTALDSKSIVKSSDRKSIRLGFDDNLDGQSVDTDGSDFIVLLNDVELQVTSAKWFDSPSTSKHVFLTLNNELPPDATPTVKLSGSIKDDAGNISKFDKTDVKDGIKPDIRFTLNGTNNEGRVITYDKLILEVISDEQIINLNSSDVTIQMLDSNSTVVPITPTSFSTIKQNMSWRWEYMFGNLSNFGKIYNVDLQLQDIAGNSVNISNPDLTNNSKSTLFELDTLIQAGLLDIDAEPKPYSYINIDYSIESVEYQHDSHNKISITQSSVDGIPVTVQTHNDVLFTIPPPEEGWTVGKHKIEMTVMDDAGNSYLYEEYFIVNVEPLFTIKLKPGFNLISLPSNPSDSNINSVIPLTHSVNLIMTYDPSNGGNWLVSERNPETNRFEGAITQIDSSKAYLLRTNSFQSLEIGLRNTFLHDSNLPSTISLHKGWNFVPIINISSQSISTQGIVANEYFKNINPTSILGINQFNNLVPIDRNEMVLYGKGYLVYLDDDDVLVPPK
jgi:hypothetical protein